MLDPLLALGPKSTYLSVGFSVLSPGCMMQLFSVVFSLLDLSLLILPLNPLDLGFKSTSFSPVFSVGRRSKYNMIIWEDIIFQFFLLVVG